jgi:hypothetical protein
MDNQTSTTILIPGRKLVRIVVGLLFLATFLPPREARSAIPETWPSTDPLATPGGSVDLAVSSEHGFVPPFRAGERNRLRGRLSSTWIPVSGIVLDGSAEFLRDHYPDDHVVAGPGDVELGVLVGRSWPLGGETGRFAAALGWRVKFPDAADEGELGSDETDVAPLAALAVERGRLRCVFAGGLAILGNPLRYASQDDMPFLRLRLLETPDAAASTKGPGLGLSTGLAWAFATSRNPARGEVEAGVSVGRRWILGLDVAAGLSPAAPDLTVSGSLSRSFQGG